MQNEINFNSLNKCVLFKGLKTNAEVKKILVCTHYKVKEYKKNEYVQLIGSPLKKIGIVVDGSCDIIKEDFNGNVTLISALSEGSIFGESLIFSEQNLSPVSIIATKKVTIYYLDLQNTLTKCSSCYLNQTILKNLLTILSNKNVVLNKKINVLSQKTIREKLITYFEDICTLKNSNCFVLPITKTKLSNYLGVDRSAMSREFKCMQNENIITVDGNNITLNHYSRV